jgi:hypothetical protein
VTDFALRKYTTDDEDFVVSSWIFSYARSAYGLACGAHVPQALPGYTKRPTEKDWGAFWCEQQPIVCDLLARADVQIACDPGEPSVIWGWACTSGDTVHFVLAKRSVHRESAKETRPGSGVFEVTTGISGDIYRALLGDRLKRACGFTHELVDFRRKELRVQNMLMPRTWFADTTWFERQRRKAA